MPQLIDSITVNTNPPLHLFFHCQNWLRVLLYGKGSSPDPEVWLQALPPTQPRSHCSFIFFLEQVRKATISACLVRDREAIDPDYDPDGGAVISSTSAPSQPLPPSTLSPGMQWPLLPSQLLPIPMAPKRFPDRSIFF